MGRFFQKIVSCCSGKRKGEIDGVGRRPVALW